MMKSLQDALYNWLSIKVVADARPDDKAAADTFNLFDEILREDHHVEYVKIEKDNVMYFLRYKKDDEEKTTRFPIELIDVMIEQMEAEPEKFPIYEQDEKKRVD